MAVGIGTGTTVTISGFTGNIEDCSFSGLEGGKVDFTHMGSTPNREYKPKELYDPGEVTLEVQHDPTVDMWLQLNNTPGNCVIDWGGDGAGSVWTNDAAWIMSYNPTAPNEEKMTATIVIACGGAWTGT